MCDITTASLPLFPHITLVCLCFSPGLTLTVAVTGVKPWEVAHPSYPRYAHFLSGFSTAGDGALPTSHLQAVLSCDENDPTLPLALLDFLCGAMYPDPDRRYTLEQLIAHPWLA